jgi:CheY-like chemotaxis protein
MGTPTVLVVDDNEKNRTLLFELFKIKNIDCICVENGHKALANISAAIKLCIVDFRLSDMNGDEVAKKIKEQYPNMPVIIWTASISKAEKCKVDNKLLFDAVLLKPIDLQNFEEIIGKFLK